MEAQGHEWRGDGAWPRGTAAGRRGGPARGPADAGLGRAAGQRGAAGQPHDGAGPLRVARLHHAQGAGDHDQAARAGVDPDLGEAAVAHVAEPDVLLAPRVHPLDDGALGVEAGPLGGVAGQRRVETDVLVDAPAPEAAPGAAAAGAPPVLGVDPVPAPIAQPLAAPALGAPVGGVALRRRPAPVVEVENRQGAAPQVS